MIEVEIVDFVIGEACTLLVGVLIGITIRNRWAGWFGRRPQA